MMETIRLQRYEITDECLERLSVDQRAMFAVLCLCVSEVDAMRKVLILGPSAPIGDENLDTAFMSQKMVFMRVIGMKILEVFTTLSLSNKENESDDPGLKIFCCDVVSCHRMKLEKHQSYTLVKAQRNQRGFHYDLNAFRKIITRKGTTAAHSVLVSDQFEFQSVPYGEIAMASGLGDPLGDPNTTYSQTDARDAFKNYTDFTTQAMRSLGIVSQAFFQTFLIPHLALSEIEKRVPVSLIARRNEVSFPLFVRPKTLQLPAV